MTLSLCVWHFDHISGVLSCLRAINKPGLPVHAHEDLLLPRAWKRKDALPVTSSFVTKEAIIESGGCLRFNTKAQRILDGTFLLSGEVPRETPYELGLSGEMILKQGTWLDAPLIMDEQCLIINLLGKGLVVFTGCGHIGVVNALRYARTLTNTRIHAIMGGFHLSGRECEERTTATINDLKKISPDLLLTGHCTGFKAQAALTSCFGERHIPYSVGMSFSF